MLKPGCGWLPDSWMYEAGIRKALRSIARAQASTLTDYASPLGHPSLRQFLSRRLGHLGVDAPLEQIMLTESGTHSIDLICRFFLEPGWGFHAHLDTHSTNTWTVIPRPSGH